MPITGADLAVSLVADASSLVKEMKKADASMDKFGKNAKKTQKDIDKGLKENTVNVKEFGKAAKIAGGLVVAGLVGSIAVMNKMAAEVDRVTSELDNLSKTAKRLSLPVEQLQEYQIIAEAAGISTGTFDTAFQRFARRVGQAKLGTGELVKTFEILDIQMTDSAGNARTNADLFDEFGRKIGGLSDKNVALALTISGVDTEGVKMVEMFRMQQKHIDSIIASYKAYGGVVFTTELTKRAEAYQTELGLIKRTHEALDKQAAMGMSAMTLDWEKFKLKVHQAALELAQFMGMMGITQDKSYQGAIKNLAMWRKQNSIIKDSIEKETDPKRIAYQQDQLKYNEKNLKVAEDLVKAKIKLYEAPTSQVGQVADPTGTTRSTETVNINTAAIRNNSLAKQENLTFDQQVLADRDSHNLAMETENGLIFAAEEAYQRQIITYEELIALRQKYNSVTAEGTETTEKSIASTIDWAQTAEDGMQRLGGSFIDAAMNGETAFGEMAAAIMKDIAAMIAKQLLFNAISGMFGAGFSSGGAFGAATGGVNQAPTFANGGAFTKFANGGDFTNSVVSQPTKFAYGGGLGVMGEAGPEAIMPLTRTSGGKLGVVAEGGGGTGSGLSIGSITVNVESNNDETGQQQGQAISRELINTLNSLVDGRVMDQRRVGNSLNPVAQVV